jgi:hypothetical protein
VLPISTGRSLRRVSLNVLLEAPDVRALQRRLRVLGRRAPGGAADIAPVRGAVDVKCNLAGHEVVARTAWRQVGPQPQRLTGFGAAATEMKAQTLMR